MILCTWYANPEWWQGIGAIGGLIGVVFAYWQLRGDAKDGKAQMIKLQELIAESANQTRLMGEYNKIFQDFVTSVLSKLGESQAFEQAKLIMEKNRRLAEIRPKFIAVSLGKIGSNHSVSFFLKNEKNQAFNIMISALEFPYWATFNVRDRNFITASAGQGVDVDVSYGADENWSNIQIKFSIEFDDGEGNRYAQLGVLTSDPFKVAVEFPILCKENS